MQLLFKHDVLHVHLLDPLYLFGLFFGCDDMRSAPTDGPGELV